MEEAEKKDTWRKQLKAKEEKYEDDLLSSLKNNDEESVYNYNDL
jgi:hypothetical protein